MVATTGPLVAIVGPTASGKTAFALSIAKRFNGEIICADSRTVYKRMDIGTAKPTVEEQAYIKHHLIDVVEPDEPFNAAIFKRLAESAIQEIIARDKLPLLVGGTGLYIDSLLYDYQFLQPVNPEERAELERLSTEELQALLHYKKIALPRNANNRRHLIRTLETNGKTPTKKPLRPNSLILGLNPGKDLLKQRITNRVEEMLDYGFIDEVKRLILRFGSDCEALQATGYKAFAQYIKGQSTLEDAKQNFIQNDVNLAKRQMTWFKRNPDIHWITSEKDAIKLIEHKLKLLK